MSELFAPTSLIALATLTALEIVLGIDNIVFIAIQTSKLPEERRALARRLGLALAAVGRVLLLLSISWIITLDKTTLFTVFGHDFKAKQLVIALGGLFLIGKATWEIHESLEMHPEAGGGDLMPARPATMLSALCQILMLDLVFSIDSVLTAVGMVEPEGYAAAWVPIAIMIAAIVLAIIIMIAFSGPLSRFIERHPTMKMLALAFLLLVGVVLCAEALGHEIQRGYIYFAMCFSLFVEILNLRVIAKRRRKREREWQKRHADLPTS